MASHMTPDELKVLIRDTVRETIDETFLRLGVKVDDPIEMQKDFQHLRDWRLTTASLKMKAFLGAIGLLTSGALAALWVGLKNSLK